VGRVREFEALTPERVRVLARRFEPLVKAGRAYWAQRAKARYATMMWLDHVRTMSEGPRWTPNGRGWLTMPSNDRGDAPA
jgi:hypothetical protein